MFLERLSRQEIETLRGLVGRKILFFAQDILDFAIIGKDWQVNISSDNVYKGDLTNFEISGLRVKAETTPNYSSTPEHGLAYIPVAANTVIRDVRIIYHLWHDEWTSNNEPFTLRLEGGVQIDTDDGNLIALLWPYDIAYYYPISELSHSRDALSEVLNAWASSYELFSVNDI